MYACFIGNACEAEINGQLKGRRISHRFSKFLVTYIAKKLNLLQTVIRFFEKKQLYYGNNFNVNVCKNGALIFLRMKLLIMVLSKTYQHSHF